MPRFAANLSFLYTDLPFPERFAAAARDGFQAVEYLFPYEHEAETLARLLKETACSKHSSMLRPATGKRVNVVWRPCPAAKRNSCKALSAPCNTPERCTARASMSWQA